MGMRCSPSNKSAAHVAKKKKWIRITAAQIAFVSLYTSIANSIPTVGMKTIYIIPMALALLGLIGQHAFATNESSYQYGLFRGFDDYQDGAHDASSSGPPAGPDIEGCNTAGHDSDPRTTNSTACKDGYLDGWEHWCKSDGVYCAFYVAGGDYPIIVTHVGKVYHCKPWCPDYVRKMNVNFTQSF
jgi:hypothetical protein